VRARACIYTHMYIYIYMHELHACTRVRKVRDDWDAQNEKGKEIEPARAACQRLGRIIPSATGKTQFPGQNLMFGRPARWGLIGFPGAVNRARARARVCRLAKIAARKAAAAQVERRGAEWSQRTAGAIIKRSRKPVIWASIRQHL